MNIPRIALAMRHIDDGFITDSILYKPAKSKLLWVKLSGMAACAALILSAVITLPFSLNGSHTADPSTVTAESTDNSSPETSDNLVENKPIYDDVFKGVNSDSFTGEPMSYDEVMEMINSPLQKENGIFLDSFYLVETIRALPDEEGRQLNGWTEICEGKTIYEVKILTDLISGEQINRTENILAATGTVEWQEDGDPVYAPGERFTVALTKPQEGCDFLQTPVSIMFRYDVVEDNAKTTLYSRKSEIDKLNLPTSTNLNEKVITSTTQNPAVHSQKVELDALVDFLRSDWEQRGVSSHFENAAN